MAKATCLFALFVAVVVCAEAIRIDPPPSDRRRPDDEISGVTKDDKRCKGKKNNWYPIKNDCTKYLKCVNGTGQERNCPKTYKFDTRRRCVSPNAKPPADCGKSKSSPSDADVECPKSWGVFPIKNDCHRYFKCADNMPKIMVCPDHHVFSDLAGTCVPGKKCPKPKTEEFKCTKANEKYADEEDCRKYIKCVNFKSHKEECHPGTAFDPSSSRCTKEQLKTCKNNDIMSIYSDE